MLMDFRRVLVLSPHTDDAELGAGGTVARFLEEGKEVHYVAFSGCEASLPQDLPEDTLRKECMCSAASLGLAPNRVRVLSYPVRTFPQHRQEILEELVRLNREVRPELVLIPSSQDMHQDHATVYWEALRAFKKDASVWGYEHPWNNLTFTTDIFVKLEERHFEKKLNALKQYRSQDGRIYMDRRNVQALLWTRGAQLGAEYAEAFELVRMIY